MNKSNKRIMLENRLRAVIRPIIESVLKGRKIREGLDPSDDVTALKQAYSGLQLALSDY